MIQHLTNFPENGTVLILNFKKGELSEFLFSKMRVGEINRGSFIITGPFTRHAWQKAHDFCNNVKNYLGKSATYFKEDYSEAIPKIDTKVDLLVAEHTSVDNAVNSIKAATSVLKKPANIMLKLPVLYHSEFESKFKEFFPKLKVTSEGNFSYITYRFDKVIKPEKVIREKNPQMT